MATLVAVIRNRKQLNVTMCLQCQLNGLVEHQLLTSYNSTGVTSLGLQMVSQLLGATVQLIRVYGRCLCLDGALTCFYSSSPQPRDPLWLVLNEAGLYWRAVGNSTFAVTCLQKALNLAPREYQDIPLVNLANLLIHYGLPLDASRLLQKALDINSSEVRFSFLYWLHGK